MSRPNGYALGVDLGTTTTCAAVVDGSGAARVVQLSGRSHTMRSIVSITADGVVAGDGAERRLVSHPADTAREFKRRFGDPAPMVLAGRPIGADILTGHLLAEAVRRVEQSEGNPPALVTLSHPASWGPFRRDLLVQAAATAGVDDVALVPEPVAAALANRDRVDDGSLVFVYDLGGGTFDAAVVRCSGDFSVVGAPDGVERLGGSDFDQAVLAHVDVALGGEVFSLDTSDRDDRSALAQLRTECQLAKEHLSQDTEVEIPVSLPKLRTSVRLTRAEFEAMVRPRLADSLSVCDRVLASTGSSWADIAAVLLVGGSSNIPAVGLLVSEYTGRPVVTATNPHLAIALGTATMGARALRGSVETPPSADSATAAQTAPDPPADDVVVPASSSRRRPSLRVVLGVLFVVAAAVGVLLYVGRGEDPEPTSTTDSVALTETAATLAIETCSVDVGDVEGLVVVNDDAVLVRGTGLASVSGTTLNPCVIDAGQAAPLDDGVMTAAPSSITSFGSFYAVSGESGGVVVNADTGDVSRCGLLTGRAAINDSGLLFVIDEGSIGRIRADAEGCRSLAETRFVGLEAAAVGVASSEQVAVGGVGPSGGLELWVFDGPTSPEVLGSDDPVPGGFGSIDAIGTCDGRWCVVDLGRGVVHHLDLGGAYLGRADLQGTDAADATVVLSAAPAADGSLIVVVRFDDGRTPVVRIS